MKFIFLTFYSFFILENLFAAESTTNWIDLLLKTFNFLALVSLILFFFGKKILISLRNIVKTEYDSFFALNKEKQNLELQLNDLKSQQEEKQKKNKKREEEYFEIIKKEVEKIEIETSNYVKKIEINNKIILEQEQQKTKKSFYKKIFHQAVKKLEQGIKQNTISIDQEKYFTDFLQKVNK